MDKSIIFLKNQLYQRKCPTLGYILSICYTTFKSLLVELIKLIFSFFKYLSCDMWQISFEFKIEFSTKNSPNRYFVEYLNRMVKESISKSVFSNTKRLRKKHKNNFF
jgi:hypothetical protein